jgi:NosR/NirI family transcriptional regulator, nitrous oxide reductase regulator
MVATAAPKVKVSVLTRIKKVFVGPGSLTDFGERFLILDREHQTSVKGMYAIGDVSGTPDIKAALNAGYRVGRHLCNIPRRTTSKIDYDVVIIGAGPAGLNAASELVKVGKKVLILERKKCLQTVRAFANSKELFLASTGEGQVLGDFPFVDCSAKECIESWDGILEQKPDIQINTFEDVQEIRQRGAFEIFTKSKKGESKTYLADRIIVAVGKPRQLARLAFGGSKEERIRYQTRYEGGVDKKDVLVVAHAGCYEGFEMALELAPNNRVTLIYEEEGQPDVSLSMLGRIESAVDSGQLTFYRGATLKSVNDKTVDLELRGSNGTLSALMDDSTKGAIGADKGTTSIPNDVIFTGKIVDREMPSTDLKNFGLNTERRMSPVRWSLFMILFAFFAFVYIGKSGKIYDLPLNKPFFLSLEKFMVGLNLGVLLFTGAVIMGLGEGLSRVLGKSSGWKKLARAFLGLSLFAVVAYAAVVKLGNPLYAARKISLFVLGTEVIIQHIEGFSGGLKLYQIWTILYSSAVVIFGFKAIYKYRTHYRDAEQGSHQTKRLLSLMFFQVFFLAILPELILHNWRAYGLVLAWPLNLDPTSYGGFLQTNDCYRIHFKLIDMRIWENHLYFAWTIFLTLGLIPILVWRKGMRYCTWICSCGGLAETVGDEWRQFSPKGPANTKREFSMYVVLGATFIIMLMSMAKHHGIMPEALDSTIDTTVKTWVWIVNLFMCGILPLVLYPYLGGRSWCRYACPTAGFMKLMSKKTTVSGIQPDRTRCIACGNCDRFCEVGVPIRKHALKGTFFSANDTTCISCGVCISVCPTDVLSFQLHPEKRPLPMVV